MNDQLRRVLLMTSEEWDEVPYDLWMKIWRGPIGHAIRVMLLPLLTVVNKLLYRLLDWLEESQ